MSHFAVVVAADDVERALAPFQEHAGPYDPTKPYLVFEDKENELRDDYENASTERVVMPDGSLKAPWDDEFRVQDILGPGPQHVVSDHLEKRQVPFRDLFATFEEYAHRWCGFETRDPDANRYGYWVNPLGKWDWHVVGGCFSGMLKLKSGETGKMGTPSFGMPSALPGCVDSCYIDDIDLESMRCEAERTAAQRYDRFHQLRAGREFPDIEKLTLLYNGDAVKAREAYWNHPVLIDLQEAPEIQAFDYKEFMVDRAVYLENARDNSMLAAALVIDGVWHEPGRQDRPSQEANEAALRAWPKQFAELFSALPPDTRVTMVDCHT